MAARKFSPQCRRVALGSISWLFAGFERGGEPAAFMHTLIVSCKMKDIEPQAWMANVMARMPDITVSRLPYVVWPKELDPNCPVTEDLSLFPKFQFDAGL